MQRHLNANPGDGKKGIGGGGCMCLCVWDAMEEGEKKASNGEGRETNVRAFVHEIKRYLQNSPACDALWRALLEVSASHFLFVCGEGRCETE